MPWRWVTVLLAACGSSSSTPTLTTPTPAAAAPGSWKKSPPLPELRFEGYAVALGAKVYYLGGITGVGGVPTSATPSKQVDVFDPLTGAWSKGPPLPADAPSHHLAVAVVGTRVYVLGGFTGIIGTNTPGEAFVPVATTYAFDGSTWTARANQPVARGAATAQAIGGIVYVAGGGSDDIRTEGDLYAYDPASDAWTQRAPMPTSREHLASCAVNGKMIVAGGWSGPQMTTTAVTEMYDPSTDRWSRLPDMPTSRGGLGGIALKGVCHFIGGERWDIPAPGTFASNEGFDPAVGAWRLYTSMPTARHGIGVALVGDAIGVFGGGPEHGNSYTDVVETFVP
jgi:N-acetylneuraminic acid mutarotase